MRRSLGNLIPPLAVLEDAPDGSNPVLPVDFLSFGVGSPGIADADLEYDPQEYPKLMAPLLAGKADVVYGSRFAGGESKRVLYYWHSVGNKFLTTLSNMFTNINLTDMETCYKVFRGEVIRSIRIEEDRFGFEPEVTSKVARMGCRIYEVGIGYSGRTYAEGKKINWKDGVRAIWCILKYR